MKKINLIFYYSDERVFDTIKEDGGERETSVRWANLFFEKYGFELDVSPLPYNEKKYKELFCLKKKNGLKYAPYLHLSLGEAIGKEADKVLKLGDEEMEQGNAATDTDLKKMHYDKANEYYIKQSQLRKLQTTAYGLKAAFENDIRRRIETNITENKEKPFRGRLPVLFCRFEQKDSLEKTLGETFKWDATEVPDEDKKKLSYLKFFWLSMPKLEGYYLGPYIVIDIDGFRTKTQYTLAHEIVHAAGDTTKDNTGTSPHIMNYADGEKYCKQPETLKMSPEDLICLKAASFVT